MVNALPLAGPRVIGQAAYDEQRRLAKITANGTVGHRVHGPLPGMKDHPDYNGGIKEPEALPKSVGQVTVVEALALVKRAPDALLPELLASEEGRNGGARKTVKDAIAARLA